MERQSCPMSGVRVSPPSADASCRAARNIPAAFLKLAEADLTLSPSDDVSSLSPMRACMTAQLNSTHACSHLSDGSVVRLEFAEKALAPFHTSAQVNGRLTTAQSILFSTSDSCDQYLRSISVFASLGSTAPRHLARRLFRCLRASAWCAASSGECTLARYLPTRSAKSAGLLFFRRGISIVALFFVWPLGGGCGDRYGRSRVCCWLRCGRVGQL
mmetsp:Transcript_17704/g.34620  ORF Transcript_17704/g.34620 Transcript_17704/m.34620 type:complete len:215 (-) Transcript_17704:18-662(-)